MNAISAAAMSFAGQTRVPSVLMTDVENLLGVGGAMAFVNTGGGGSDANGVTAGDYYKLLSKAFGGSGTLEP